MEKPKLVNNIDHYTWAEFMQTCYNDKIRAGHRLTEILKEFLKKRGKKNETQL